MRCCIFGVLTPDRGSESRCAALSMFTQVAFSFYSSHLHSDTGLYHMRNAVRAPDLKQSMDWNW
ncbi:hypothetical protein KVT40_000057 [Elsinoe batatas]|uniref:Uncharacterized protein n=1 Tax=Elsinoe batatas TaxID=2601811 RepID=A0A8K0PJW3_9PEZI|nr:hypothetical protein KVT40_000057 [Elsinoe batatas]